ncbi:hypothetical protein BU15DRAFT_83006 [Melanogaster broomeanus]|nr:hypothetical protein BU15DRAFT_83006 [Melanogaster broomeanus]
MSLYLASTITSQITLTFGGSLFPGALGSMLIEVLPFLRGIATSIQQRLGDDNPNLLPTVVAAYTLTSFITGSDLCSFRRIPAAVLFSRIHTPLLLSSFVPALFLSVSIRMPALSKATRGFTDHALYVPVYMFFIAGLFWTVAAGAGYANVDGMTRLSSDGWLFTMEESVLHQKGIGSAWDYWSLFDFSKVEWSAMSAAIENIVLLVVIGVLNLPIYIPAMALVLDVPSYNMNHELIGHGVSNIFAGAVGTIPNLVHFVITRFSPTRDFSPIAGGGRFEGTVVILLTIVLFFVSSLILPLRPDDPRVNSSALPGHRAHGRGTLGVHQIDSCGASMLWFSGLFWLVPSLVSLPVSGLALGFAVVVHFAWCVIDSMPRIQHFVNLRNEYNPLPPSPSASLTRGVEHNRKSWTPTVTFIKLSGYAFFAGIPSLERQMKLPADRKSPIVFVLDFTDVHRVETSVAQYFERKASEYSSKSPAEVYVDGSASLLRMRESEVMKSGLLAFTDIADAVRWVKSLRIHDVELTDSEVFDEFCRLIGDQNAGLPHSELPVIQRRTTAGY